MKLVTLVILVVAAVLWPAACFSPAAQASSHNHGTIRISMDVDGVPHVGTFHLVTLPGAANMDAAAAEILSRFPRASLLSGPAPGDVSAQFEIYPYRWADGSIRLGYNPAGAPAYLVDGLASMQRAADTWNNSGISFRFAKIQPSLNGPGACNGGGLDGQSTIGWGPRNDGSLASACYWTVEGTQDLVEVDIEFHPAWTWTTGSAVDVDLESVALHELGHALALAHSEIPEAVMHAWLAQGDMKRGLHPDDVAGALALYPVGFTLPSGGSFTTWESRTIPAPALELGPSDGVYQIDRLTGRWTHYRPASPGYVNSLTELRTGDQYWFVLEDSIFVPATELGEPVGPPLD